MIETWNKIVSNSKSISDGQLSQLRGVNDAIVQNYDILYQKIIVLDELRKQGKEELANIEDVDSLLQQLHERVADVDQKTRDIEIVLARVEQKLEQVNVISSNLE